MKRISLKTSIVLCLLTLAACGQSTGDRALSGGAIGAGAGAVGGALLGSPGTGALTSPSTVDLGKPVWER